MASENNSTRKLKENPETSVKKQEKECEFCKKLLDKEKLLKHIGNSKICKTYYGSRFTILKEEQEIERKRKYRENMREEINERQRKKREPEKKRSKKNYQWLQRD